MLPVPSAMFNVQCPMSNDNSVYHKFQIQSPMSNVKCQMLILIFLLLNVCVKSVFSSSTVYISNLFSNLLQIFFKCLPNFFLSENQKKTLTLSLCPLTDKHLHRYRRSVVVSSCGAKVSMTSKIITEN